LYGFDVIDEPNFVSYYRDVMYGFFTKLVAINIAYGMRFFSEGSHGRNNRGRRNWNRGPRRLIFSIHFDANP